MRKNDKRFVIVCHFFYFYGSQILFHNLNTAIMRSKNKLLLIAFALSTVCSLSSCASPPFEAKKPDVTFVEHRTYNPGNLVGAKEEVLFTAYVADMNFLDGTIVAEQPTVDPSPANVVSDESVKNCSGPQCIGSAIRLCGQKRLIPSIHIIIAATSGHRLLHVDPGIC